MGTTHEQFNVGGMSCSFCAESIKKAYARTEGVEDVDVSLAHEEVLVQYDDAILSEVKVKDTLRDLGYTIRDPDKAKRYEQQQAELADGKQRLLLAGGASVVVAALMGWMIFVVGRFESASLAMDIAALALALGTMFGPGRYITKKAFQSLRRGIFNQHVLLEAGARSRDCSVGSSGCSSSLGSRPSTSSPSPCSSPPTTSSRSTPVSPSGRGPRRPSRASSTSSRTLPVASPGNGEIEEVPRRRPRGRQPSPRQARRERPCRRRRRRRKLNGRRVGCHRRAHPRREERARATR